MRSLGAKLSLTLFITLGVMAPPTTPAATPAGRTTAESFNTLDPDGNDTVGEAWAIRQRVRLYIERHGDNGVLTPEMELADARFRYKRWLEQERDFRTKGIQGDTSVNLGPNNGAGRCVSLAPHPTDIGTVLVGAAGGGVWRTRDGGQTWEPLTDGMPNLSIGAVAYAPSDPNVVYVGTGEGGFAVDFIAGIGLLRSDDGGDTWTLPTDVVASQFFRISVDPRDPDVLLAATNEGLLRSEDGGVSWTTPIPARSGSGSRELVVTDVVRSHTNPDRLYAALWCFDSTCPAGTGRVMRSEDGGVTWTPAATGLPLPASDWSLNRMGLALSPNNDSRLVVAMNRPGSGPPVEVYTTANGGTSWTKLADPEEYLGAQGWYDNTITIKPGNDSFILGAGVYYVFSTDGGLTWSTRNPYQTSGLPHVDFHDLQWQAGTLWTACDGGVWKSTDGGTSWTDVTAGLITRQYYGLAIDPVHRERVFAGAQDNGTNRRNDIGGTYLATLVAEDGKGGTGLASAVVRVDDASNYCQSPRVVPSAGPFPVTLLGNNTVAGSATSDPAPPCVNNPDDPKVGTWGSMWFEFTPAENRTYTDSAGGTYGQFIPAVPATSAVDSSGSALLVQLRNDSAFRTNVGVVNLTGAPIQVEAQFLASDGSSLGSRSWTIPAYGFHQENGAVPGNGEVAVSAVLRCLTQGGRFLAYGSVVDNVSGDPVFVPAVVSE